MAKKRINEEADEAVDHGDGDDTGNWLGLITEIGEREREARADRISMWANTAGPPHAEIMLGDDPQYMDRIGFWRVPGGVIRIRASKRGEFDPAERTDITDVEIKAIIDASQISFRAVIEDCLAAGITVTELADEFKVSTSTISRWRSGRSAPGLSVRQEVSKRLAAMLLQEKTECSEANPCCDRADEYNGFSSGPLLFTCPKNCPCHD